MMLLTSTALATTFIVAAAHAETKPDSAAARLAIEAAVPIPETANVSPLKPGDVQQAKPADAQPSDTAAAKPDAAPAEIKPAETKSDTASAPAAASEPAKAEPAKIESTNTEPAKSEPAKSEPASAADPAAAPATQAGAPAATVAAPAVAAADQPVADQIKALIETRLSRYIDRKDDRDAAQAFYAARGFAPLWLDAGAPNARAKDAIAFLKGVDAMGLFPEDYQAPDFAAATTPEAQAEAELKFTDTVLTYARHAQSGRVAYSRVSANVEYPAHDPDSAEVLGNVAKAADMARALASYEPPHDGYRALKAKLAEVRGGEKKKEPEVVRVPDGKLIRPGAEDERVVLLRKRLNVAENADSAKYDAGVVAAVETFQKENGLNPDGVIGPSTLRKLNGDKATDNVEETILANLERWRWLPRKLGDANLGNAYVMLNIPDFTLKVMQNGKQLWKTRVVTGKPGRHETPLLTETMKYITVNPTWNVPPSIVYNEYLPALQQDPGVLERMGLKLTQNRDGSVHISQPPGERNALGRLRFNFPNKFLVYQHDTPDKHLFAHDTRAYSHGCMRVQNPDQYAEVLLGIALPKENYTAEKIRSMYGRSEQNIQFPTPVPVHITYQTAFVDDDGKLQLRKDIYGNDQALLAHLKDGARKNADVAVARAQPSYSRPSVNLPRGVAYAGSGWQSDGPSFFERLFGGGFQEPAGRDPRFQRRGGPQR